MTATRSELPLVPKSASTATRDMPRFAQSETKSVAHRTAEWSAVQPGGRSCELANGYRRLAVLLVLVTRLRSTLGRLLAR